MSGSDGRVPGSVQGRLCRTLLVLAMGLQATGAVAAGETPAGSRARPNLLLITLDTTRADHLGSYGYAKNTSPKLDEMAADAVIFDRAYSTSSWTLPAHASLLTGKFPSSHGALYDQNGALGLADGIRDQDGKLENYRVNPLGEEGLTLAELLRDDGYSTGAVVAGPWMRKIFGLSRGFQSYDDEEITIEDDKESSIRGRLASQVSRRAIEFIEGNKAQPFFLFLNFYDPHLPFSDPDGLASMFFPEGRKAYPIRRHGLTHAEQAAYYDGEIRYMDRFLGRIFDRLKMLELYGQTWIIVTADHGELLGEKHGVIGHGKSLYEGEVRIPLIVKYPHGEVTPGRSERFMQLTDIASMVSERLVPARAGEMASGEKSVDVFAEVYPSHLKLGEKDWQMVVLAPFKLLSSSTGDLLLFNLDSDPIERENLSETDAARVAEMQKSLTAFTAKLPTAPSPKAQGEVDEDLRRALESLGYLE